MPEKPFIAARIPEGLNQALNQHVEATGESRTESITNALAQYLHYTLSEPIQNNATTKLETLENRVARLEEILANLRPGQDDAIRADNNADNEYVHEESVGLGEKEDELNAKSLDTRMITTDIRVDTQVPLIVIEPSISARKMTTKQLAEVCGMNPETVKARSRKGHSVEYDGIEWVSIKEGRSTLWIPKTTDNNEEREEVAF